MVETTRPSNSQNSHLAKMGFFWLDYNIESDFFCQNELLSFSKCSILMAEQLDAVLAHTPYRQ